EKFKIYSYWEKQAEYSSMLMVGMGLYSTRNWQKAQTCFKRALEQAKETEAGLSIKKEQHVLQRLREHKVLLKLLCGHCSLNMRTVGKAIETYNEGIELAEGLARERKRQIQYQLYASRAVAYREINAFEAAAKDFKIAAEHFGAGGEYKPPYYAKMDARELYELATILYRRGNNYLQNDDTLVYALPQLDESVRILRDLCEQTPLPKLKSKYELELVRSLVRLAEARHRQARP
ncbi:unnamed protein product, partial [marine sediment metagenome]